MTPARRSLVLFGLLAISGSLVAWDRLRPRAVVADAVARKPGPATPGAAVAREPAQNGATTTASLAMARDRNGYLASGADAFPSLLPPPPPASLSPAAATEAPKPVAPPVPFTVIGKKFEGGTWEVYLARGEQTYIASEGAELAGEYRVGAVGPTQLTLIYLPLNEQQTLQTGAPLHE
jgi:hypothetical protein